MPTPIEYQTLEGCREVHRGTRWWLGLFMVALIALVTVNVASAGFSWVSAERANEVRIRAEKLEAISDERRDSVNQALREMVERLNQIDQNQRMILKELGNSS